MFNKIWVSFFLVSFIACLYQAIFLANVEIFAHVIDALFSMAQTAVTISIGLIGILCLWLGIFAIAENSGLIHILSRGLAPFFHA